MAVLGVNMTDKEPVYGWESVKPTHHYRRNPLLDYSVRAYELASQMVDTGESLDTINMMNDLAKVLQDMALAGDDCTCTPRDGGACRVCKAVGLLFSMEEEYPWHR